MSSLYQRSFIWWQEVVNVETHSWPKCGDWMIVECLVPSGKIITLLQKLREWISQKRGQRECWSRGWEMCNKKSCLLVMTWPPHSWIHRPAYLHDTGAGSGSSIFIRNERRTYKKPHPSQSDCPQFMLVGGGVPHSSVLELSVNCPCSTEGLPTQAQANHSDLNLVAPHRMKSGELVEEKGSHGRRGWGNQRIKITENYIDVWNYHIIKMCEKTKQTLKKPT